MNIIGQNIYENFPLILTEDLQGWNSNHNVFSDLIEEKKPNVIIEVGTWKGASAINMAKFCKEKGLNAKIYCIDTWLGAVEFWTDFKEDQQRDLILRNGYPQVYYQFLTNVIRQGVKDFIIPIPVTSSIGAKVLAHYGIKADLIYIDGSHEYEDVKADIIAYRELLNTGGVIFGDDFTAFSDVAKAVKEVVRDFNVVDNNFWIAKF